jgi:hypothetical protein
MTAILRKLRPMVLLVVFLFAVLAAQAQAGGLKETPCPAISKSALARVLGKITFSINAYTEEDDFWQCHANSRNFGVGIVFSCHIPSARLAREGLKAAYGSKPGTYGGQIHKRIHGLGDFAVYTVGVRPDKETGKNSSLAVQKGRMVYYIVGSQGDTTKPPASQPMKYSMLASLMRVLMKYTC